MSSLSPRLQLKVQQKQILTPGLVQMVTILQLNRIELREMIANELAENPILEEASTPSDDPTPGEIQATMESERDPHPADEGFLDAVKAATAPDAGERSEPVPEAATDPFNEIDFGSFFEEYLDPGFRAPAGESVEKASFETFLSAPVTLADYLQQQLSLVVLSERARDAADEIIGNLDPSGYLRGNIEEIGAPEGYTPAEMEEALALVQSLDPSGVGARDLRECLLLQLKARGAEGGVAWKIVADHLRLLEAHKLSELAKALGRPLEHVQVAVAVIQRLDPSPGLQYSGQGARHIEPEVHIFKEGEDYVIQLNDEDIPQLRLNLNYRHMVNRNEEPSKEVRDYVKDRYSSALQLIKSIEQRKQTILRVCEAIVSRQREFLDQGIDQLKPMMIKEVAEEIGVHPSTVSRAVANKYAHTPQGVHELRFFFSEAVQGPSGAATPLLVLKRRVKQMIEAEDAAKPLTDEQITKMLREEGIQVTRRTVAKYREDMKIPSTHQRRVRP
jgi:RNA polymerase sigma-54 factor